MLLRKQRPMRSRMVFCSWRRMLKLQSMLVLYFMRLDTAVRGVHLQGSRGEHDAAGTLVLCAHLRGGATVPLPELHERRGVAQAWPFLDRSFFDTEQLHRL
ncbi:unnamed protein product [Urochloa humidicola]